MLKIFFSSCDSSKFIIYSIKPYSTLVLKICLTNKHDFESQKQHYNNKNRHNIFLSFGKFPFADPCVCVFLLSSFFYLLPGKAGIHFHQSRVIARTRQAAASTQFTMVNIVSPSFAFFVFSSSVHRFLHHVCHQSDGNGTSKNCKHHFLFLCSMAAFIFCRIFFGPISCSVSPAP